MDNLTIFKQSYKQAMQIIYTTGALALAVVILKDVKK